MATNLRNLLEAQIPQHPCKLRNGHIGVLPTAYDLLPALIFLTQL
jgi:hypothetical protein